MSSSSASVLSAPLLPESATASDGIRAWIEMEHTCEAFLLAGLRQEIGPGGNLDEAYRNWYEQYADTKSKAFIKMCENFSRRQKVHG